MKEGALIRVGTASWTDPTLIASKAFYPTHARTPETRLRYYASRFSMVEVDSSYYALPNPHNAELWAARTPRDFVFNIKAFRLFTGHQTPAKMLPADLQRALTQHFDRNKHLYYKDTPPEIRDELWRRFELGIRPLKDAGKLRAVHFQFPHWVKPTPQARKHIEECRDRLGEYRLAVEFRSISWFDGRRDADTLAWERANELVHVVVDEPQGTVRSVPQVWAATQTDLAIVRLHGRNARTWDSAGPSASDRFDYDYPDAEIMQLAGFIGALAREVAELHVIFNNNYGDQGQRNATSMMAALGLSRSPASSS